MRLGFHRQTTRLVTPHGIWIQSAVLSQYTFQTDRPTDRQTDRPTHGIGDRSISRARTLYYIDIVSDMLKVRKDNIGHHITAREWLCLTRKVPV